MKWETLDSTFPLSDEWIRIRRDKCRMPDGRLVDPYYVLERPDYCMIFRVTADNQVVLVEQYRQGAGVISLEIPGGLCEPGESEPEAAARRELLEETGYGKGNFTLLGELYPNPAVQDNRAFCYLARNVEKVDRQDLDDNEDISVRLASVDKVREMVFSSQIKHAVHLGCIFLALDRLQL